MPISMSEFKNAMAHVPAPVTVVTTQVDRKPFGATVSAFASLSVTPPMVVFALDSRGTMIHRLQTAGCAGINILHPSQSDVALQFASKTEDRFRQVAWQMTDGLPQLTDASVWLHCARLECAPGGDHTIVTATVDEATVLREDSMVHYNRCFGSATAAMRPME